MKTRRIIDKAEIVAAKGVVVTGLVLMTPVVVIFKVANDIGETMLDMGKSIVKTITD